MLYARSSMVTRPVGTMQYKTPENSSFQNKFEAMMEHPLLDAAWASRRREGAALAHLLHRLVCLEEPGGSPDGVEMQHLCSEGWLDRGRSTMEAARRLRRDPVVRRRIFLRRGLRPRLLLSFHHFALFSFSLSPSRLPSPLDSTSTHSSTAAPSPRRPVSSSPEG